jgi:hypothetical protein
VQNMRVLWKNVGMEKKDKERKGRTTNVWFAGDYGYKTAEGPCLRSVLTPTSQPLVLVNLKDL